MNATEYRRYHESFMENNHGSSLLHTFLCIFYTVQCTFKTSIVRRNKSEFLQYVYEYLFIVLPMIFVHTLVPSYMGVFICIDTIFLMYKLSKVLSKTQIQRAFLCNNRFKSKIILSISCMRGLTYLITVFSILAVDFRCFPRYMAKTERFGYSFMDTGVGLFVLMSGLVHRSISKDNFVSVLKGNLKFVTVLVVLGIARFVSVKQLDYQEHVSEYGVHWNFFFTLAACKLISSILLLFLNQPLRLSICTMILHEFLLHYYLQSWVFSDTPRVSFVDANREGIASSLGYISLYLFAVHIKQELSDHSIQRYRLLMKFTSAAILFMVLSYVVHTFKPASRTLANTSYCLYISTILIIVLTLLYILEVLSEDKETDFHFEVPIILRNINKNGLVYFLVANLTTGLINMSMQTLLVPTSITVVILNIYMIFAITVTVYLNKMGLSI
ncbi:uncharacterized protein [Epargyreus clarus]|uniref:uncharacterized protein n=1 Tax=Epargyreus clarus TaxID=520877 RepID=UPI003C2C4136